ncbi:hypothetical protein GQ44DRAFT_818041 [Phaeosphaeriaceae sp. PMI808]|nr:hypothetical protein GQ44DRAFT_818041 [Phaeosphaeriaceae sp. PMI808]
MAYFNYMRQLIQDPVDITFPLLLIADACWKLYFASDLAHKIHLVDAVDIGTTADIIGCYTILEALRVIFSLDRTWLAKAPVLAPTLELVPRAWFWAQARLNRRATRESPTTINPVVSLVPTFRFRIPSDSPGSDPLSDLSASTRSLPSPHQNNFNASLTRLSALMWVYKSSPKPVAVPTVSISTVKRDTGRRSVCVVSFYKVCAGAAGNIPNYAAVEAIIVIVWWMFSTLVAGGSSRCTRRAGQDAEHLGRGQLNGTFSYKFVLQR